MMTHDEVMELAELYVLNALPFDIAEEVEDHLSGCPSCQAEVNRAWQVAQLLRVAVPEVSPSIEAHNRLMNIINVEASQARRTAVAAPPPAREAEARRGWARAFGVVRWASSAAFIPLLLTAWLTFQVLGMRDQVHSSEMAMVQSRHAAQSATEIMAKAMERGGRMVRVEGAEMAPSASGKLYYARDDSQGVLVVGGLPPLAQGKVYQCWLMSGDKRLSGGTFYLEEDGRGLLVINASMPIESVDAVGVTTEPHGGSQQPQSGRYMWARVKGT